MGGRGGSSGLASGRITGLSVTMNMTDSEFRKRVESNGAQVQSISASERAKEEIKRKTDRKVTNDFLDRETASNRTLSSGSRADSRVNRMNRRRRIR